MRPNCNHIRQEFDGYLIPCAAPKCPEGQQTSYLYVVSLAKEPFLILDELPMSESDYAVAQKYCLERLQPAYMTGYYLWWNEDCKLIYKEPNLYEIWFPEYVDKD